MSTIADNYNEIVATIPSDVKLITISKTKSNAQILEVYQCGQRLFGESKVQELLSKFEQLPADISWHLVGHLQSNKVKYIAPFISLIHSVDSFKLLKTINTEAGKNKRIIDCLLQMHIAEEETKFGFDYEELTLMLGSEEFRKMENIRIIGLMCMATYTDDTAQIRREFQLLQTYFKKIRETYFRDDFHFTEKSMGMSDDYMIAIEEGSTMVRVGSKIFGNRQSTK
jgi:PLP dependent protein